MYQFQKFSWRRKNENRRGVVSVEFALTAPLLFLLLFAALELGHANMVLNTAEAAAYEGARVGIIPGATAAECQAAANRILDVCSVHGAQVVVTPANLNLATDTVAIDISVPYSQNTMGIANFTGSLVISRRCELTRE
ncbi:TadE/TadG family type IV pilus assembly protein [Aureliella helgolandensis]|uniref:TadE-like protein n=1 Tax=Aureliella helgolandensis TaxID=2527968 RepID=A0A518G8V1_9BACT|nr:TadE/TadG family type IV pilus assembly protein [Aureliella helgolandensis]QDV25016.1 TadE-like protein [Aureliella helgolandensis]